MERLVIAAVVVVAAAVFAVVMERRRPAPPTQSAYEVPSQLDRDDFDRPDVPWLVAVFSSATCDACAEAVGRARRLAGDDVVVQDVEVGARNDLHKRYGVDAVPMIVIADAEGVVRRSFVGPPMEGDLAAALDELRHAV